MDNFLSYFPNHLKPTPTKLVADNRLIKMEKFLELAKDLGQVDETTVV
jgi:hypothetical protein